MKPENIFSALSALRQEGRLRQVRDLRMETASLGTDREGKRYIVFNSNDYLGMTHAKEVQEVAAKAVRFGTGSGGARLTSGAAFELSDLEKEIADFKHTEDAVIFNTGYMANLGVLYALAGKGDVIFSDELNHASIVDGCRISKAETAVYRHSDMADLERLLQTVPCEGQRFIVTDGVFSMDGDICPLPVLAALKKDYGACLIVDDAHASGVIGRTGRGTAEYFQMAGIDVQVGTLSKAFGAEGGYIAASREICDYLRNTSRPFIFSTAISAVTGAAALAALRLLKADPEKYLGRLRENTAYMRNLLTEIGVDIAAGDTPIIPVVVGDEKEALATAEACRVEGILLSAIRPENPVLAWVLFGFEWGMVALATTLTAIDLKKYRVFSMICYIGMGWAIIFFAKQALQALTFPGFLLLLLGGIAYTVGSILYGLGKRRKWMHSVFHIFVDLGALLQFFCVLFYAI